MFSIAMHSIYQPQARQNEIVTLTDAANDVEELALTMDDDEKVLRLREADMKKILKHI